MRKVKLRMYHRLSSERNEWHEVHLPLAEIGFKLKISWIWAEKISVP